MAAHNKTRQDMPEADAIPAQVHRQDGDAYAVTAELEWVQNNYNWALGLARDYLQTDEDQNLQIKADDAGQKVVFAHPGRTLDPDAELHTEPVENDDQE